MDNSELFEKYISVHHAFKAFSQREHEERGPMGDTSRGVGRVLALLKMKDGVKARDMATVLGISVSSLNETLARMERDGYIKRTPSQEDKRVMLIYLTEEGKALEGPRHDLADILFAEFNDEEREQLGGYFDRMMRALCNEMGISVDEMNERMEQRRRWCQEGRGGGCGHHDHEQGHGGPGHGHGHGHGPGRGGCCEDGHGHGEGGYGHGRGGHGHGPGAQGHGGHRGDFDGKPNFNDAGAPGQSDYQCPRGLTADVDCPTCAHQCGYGRANHPQR